MSIRRKLYRFYWALKKVMAPSLRFAQTIYGEDLKERARPGIDWLDLGCGHQLLPNWRTEEELRLASAPRLLVGLDYTLSSLKRHRSIKNKVQGNITYLPFESDTFDLVTANMVIEHLRAPEKQFTEVARVLRRGGLFLFHTPNVWGYTTIVSRLIPELLKAPIVWLLEGRSSHDVFPTYYRANSRKRILKIAKKAGFKVVRFRYIATEAQLAMVPPLVPFELIWIRLLLKKPFEGLRPNLIVTLQKT